MKVQPFGCSNKKASASPSEDNQFVVSQAEERERESEQWFVKMRAKRFGELLKKEHSELWQVAE
jgi:hypothetical protein